MTINLYCTCIRKHKISQINFNIYPIFSYNDNSITFKFLNFIFQKMFYSVKLISRYPEKNSRQAYSQFTVVRKIYYLLSW